MHFQPLVHQPGRQDCLSQLSFGQQRKSRDLQGLGKLDIGEKIMPSPAGNVMEAFSSRGAQAGVGLLAQPWQAAVAGGTEELLFHLNFSLQGAH